MKVLIAEDDQFTRDGLTELLRGEGYRVVAVADGAQAVAEFQNQQPDFVCLDVMMPEKSGYEACQLIRSMSPDVPIIFISAKSEEMDRLVGFNSGADDFIIKPFSVREVLARVRAVARRCCKDQLKKKLDFEIGDLVVLPNELRAKRGDEVMDLSLRDIAILRLLVENVGKAMDRNTIFQHAWGEDYILNSRTLDQHISQLRKRIEVDPKQPKLIRTVHGVGYRYEPED